MDLVELDCPTCPILPATGYSNLQLTGNSGYPKTITFVFRKLGSASANWVMAVSHDTFVKNSCDAQCLDGNGQSKFSILIVHSNC